MALVRRLAPFFLFYLVVQTVVRIVLAVRAGADLFAEPGEVARAFAVGLLFDGAVGLAYMVPLALWWLVLPSRAHGGRLDRLVTRGGFLSFVALTGFTAIGEQLFWTEFSTRYNFIAVDYLVYTTEVIGNIFESYPVIPLLAGLFAVAAAITWALRRFLVPGADGVGFGRRAAAVVILAAVTWGTLATLSLDLAERGRNALADEVAKNGVHSLVHAFFHNEIDYDRFYATIDAAEAVGRVRKILAEPGSSFEHASGEDLTRVVRAGRPFTPKNVIFVVMESMSADYMGRFGNRHGLTPNLDRLAGEGLFFANAYATGTRTVRGLEAITLSVPPTPGQSIVRRPGNGGLFSVGSVFADLGYETNFIYGGYGYFDNMNAFYRANGFTIVDRTDMPKDEVRFGNVWGVSDEDLFARVIKEADRAHAAGKKFFDVVMTTSNHRPYTFPEGTIDAPQKKKTSGVKYADHAVGKLVEAARTKPWFGDTVFVFIADHTSGSAGKVELALAKYHIPIIVWAPGFVAPRQHDRAISQIDIGPTVLGLLGASYRSRFYGRDVVATGAGASPVAGTGPVAGASPVYVSTYQKVALVRDGKAVVLEPGRRIAGMIDGQPAKRSALPDDLVKDAIATYQFAADWKIRSARVPSTLPAQVAAPQ